MRQDNKVFLYLAAAAALLLFFVGRLTKRSAPVILSAGGCDSSAADNDLQAWAQDLADMFRNTWMWFDTDYDKAVQILNNIPDQCGARRFYDYFGRVETFVYGSGDLDYWLRDWPEAWKSKARTYLYGVGSF